MIATSNNSYQYECCSKTNNNNNIRTTNQQLCKWFHVNISERKCNELLLKFISPHRSNNISILKKKRDPFEGSTKTKNRHQLTFGTIEHD